MHQLTRRIIIEGETPQPQLEAQRALIVVPIVFEVAAQGLRFVAQALLNVRLDPFVCQETQPFAPQVLCGLAA